MANAGSAQLGAIHSVPEERKPDSNKRSEAAAHFRAAFECLGLDFAEAHLEGTERRVVGSYCELFGGLYEQGPPDLRSFPNREHYRHVVAVTGIKFYSICSHHLLPFHGVAHVGYLPKGRLVGLSKLARVVDYCSRRPQVQERLTEEIVESIDRRLDSSGVIAVLQARHLCMEMCGAAKIGALTTTSAVRGAFQHESARREFSGLVERSSNE